MPQKTQPIISPRRPQAIVSELEVVPYKKHLKPQFAVEALLEGYHVLVLDFYSSGLEIVNALRQFLKTQFPQKNSQQQWALQKEYRRLSHHILMEVSNSKIKLKKAPQIGWLQILYPDIDEFLLSFPDIQGLNSAWQWYKKGVNIPVINQYIFPWYGTYFPTRFEHLELFDEYLSQYEGKKNVAIDVGIGSGVLSFQMIHHGFQHVLGTDSNPNAIIGMQQELERKQWQQKISLHYGDLFADSSEKADLIVFNPPWLPLTREVEGIEQAMYYNHDLFPRFFKELNKHISPNGKVVLLFSNLAQITNTTQSHPIEEELANTQVFKKVALYKKEVRKASSKTKRNLSRREKEKVELWVLASTSH